MLMNLFLAILLGVAGQRAAAQTPAPVKLYVFDCGTLKSGNPGVLLERGVTTTDMSVSAYLIVHPRGTLLWDTGVIPDELVKPEGTVEARATVHKTLQGQLAEIGYKPSDITFLALSHNHYDHSANANSFTASTWLVQKAERAAMFPDTPPQNPNNAAARFSALKNSKTRVLDGDYDVFGDGSVVIIATPGHTPGHQSFVIDTREGRIVIAGQAWSDASAYARDLLARRLDRDGKPHPPYARPRLIPVPRHIPAIRLQSMTLISIAANRP